MGLAYQKRRLKVNKMKRRINSFRIMLLRIRLLLSFLIIVIIIYGSYKIIKLPQWYLDLNKLSHADTTVLKIQGNIITPDYKIINIIRQTQLPYIQIFRLNTKELEENISQLQTVKKVYIRRYWFPARLSVTIDERIPVFLLAPNLNSEPNSALTADGILIDHDYFPFKTQIKAKKILTYGVKDGMDEVWDKKRVEEIIKLTKAIETYSNQEVQYIDIRNQSDIYIMLKDYLVRFGEINDTAQQRAKYIASVLPQAEKYGDKIKYIDLRWEESKYLRLDGVKEEENNQPISNKNIKKEVQENPESQQSNTVEEEENNQQETEQIPIQDEENN